MFLSTTTYVVAGTKSLNQLMCVSNRHRRTNIFWPFLSHFISSWFMKSWSVTIKTVWYLKPAGQMVKTSKSRKIGPFSFCSSHLLWYETSSFKKKQDERNLTVKRWSTAGAWYLQTFIKQTKSKALKICTLKVSCLPPQIKITPDKDFREGLVYPSHSHLNRFTLYWSV